MINKIKINNYFKNLIIFSTLKKIKLTFKIKQTKKQHTIPNITIFSTLKNYNQNKTFKQK